MNQTSDLTVLDQARALGTALDGLTTALASGDPDAVLRAEAPLAAAVAACARPAAACNAADADAVGAEVTRASRLLARCRVSGAALTAILEATLNVLGHDGAYDRQGGRPVTGSIRRHDLHARM